MKQNVLRNKYASELSALYKLAQDSEEETGNRIYWLIQAGVLIDKYIDKIEA